MFDPGPNYKDPGATPFARYQEAIKELYTLEPDECLKRIAKGLRRILNCQTVCILLWNEAKQKLITEYESGLPENLHKKEEYRPDEGLTGKILFSEATWVNCKIDISRHRIYDKPTRRYIVEPTIKWEHMEAYAQSSKHGFRNLLGAPLYVRTQKLGAVKLINKLSKGGELNQDGFDDRDVETLSYFLDAIEHVVEIKQNEKRVQSLLQVGEKIISAASGYQGVLKEIADKCADALNYRVCLIRLIGDQDVISNVDLSSHKMVDVKRSPPEKAIELKTPLKCNYLHGTTLVLESTEGGSKLKLSKVPSRFVRFLRHYEVSSFLIVPIVDRGTIIGTFECYASLPREFPTAELNAIRMYIDALIISNTKDRQQLLLTNLIEMQRISALTDNAGADEEKVVSSVLAHIRNLLGRRLKLLAVVFSERGLASAKLKCDQVYGVSKKALEAQIGAGEFNGIVAELGGSRSTNSTAKTSNGRPKPKEEREELDLIKVAISPQSDRPPLGTLLLGMQASANGDGLPQHVAQLGAHFMAVMLANIEEFNRSRGLPAIIRDASRPTSQHKMYNHILEQTTGYFGFDFGAISRVDHMSRMIQMVESHSVKKYLVNPAEWMSLSCYPLDSDDILSWVYQKKEHVIIDAAKPGEPRDRRLNEDIYYAFEHQDLARIWVPFIFREFGPSGERGNDLVLGVIEAGYHRETQDHIDKELSEKFVLFVESCANSLQRITLLEERKSVDDIFAKFNQEMNSSVRERIPERILQKLLEESVKLVRGDWGDITFLTHSDAKIRFLDDTISYNLPPLPPDQFKRELDVGETGNTGLIGYVAWSQKPYWSNDVANEPRYVEECPKVKSELAVPLRFSGRTIGVLDINSNNKDWFDERKANLIQAVADQAVVLYQQARVVEPLYELISPFNPFANPTEIYTRVVEIIEEFLATKTVSIWQKVPKDELTDDQFTLKLVWASEGLREKYAEAKIKELPQDCFTGRAALGEVVEVNQQQIKTEFITAKFAIANELRSMTAVPIRAGDEIYGVIDVFSRRDTKLFPEEVAILQILASKAAVALQSALLIQSFNEIALITPGDNIQSVLERITQSALVQLHADPVVLYRYDAETRQLEPQAISAGTFHYPEVHIVTTKNEMAKLILETKESQWFKNETDYYGFLSTINRTWHSERFTEDFWHREKIKSLAALKLEYGGELVGMMYINYREPQIFPESQQRMMEVFAAQAASVIYNAKIWERNDRYWETRRADSLSLSVNEIVSSLAHNSGNLIFSANLGLGDLQEYLSKISGDTVSKSEIEDRLKSLNDTMGELTEDFKRLKDYRRLGKLNITPCDINELIRQTLHFIRTKLQKQRIKVDTSRLAKTLPLIPADHNQIQHVLLNLFINAAEAMDHKGRLAVATKLGTDSHAGFVQIRISDTGSGIATEHRNQIFTPNFSTKKLKEGSGMGLPIVRYIVENHGGTVDFTSGVRKGSNFFVYLPVS